jgi:hypothetical protein
LSGEYSKTIECLLEREERQTQCEDTSVSGQDQSPKSSYRISLLRYVTRHFEYGVAIRLAIVLRMTSSSAGWFLLLPFLFKKKVLKKS